MAAILIYRNIRVVPFGLGDVYLAAMIGAMVRIDLVMRALVHRHFPGRDHPGGIAGREGSEPQAGSGLWSVSLPGRADYADAVLAAPQPVLAAAISCSRAERSALFGDCLFKQRIPHFVADDPGSTS